MGFYILVRCSQQEEYYQANVMDNTPVVYFTMMLFDHKNAKFELIIEWKIYMLEWDKICARLNEFSIL